MFWNLSLSWRPLKDFPILAILFFEAALQARELIFFMVYFFSMYQKIA